MELGSFLISLPTNPAGGVQDSSEPEVLGLAGVLALRDGGVLLVQGAGVPGQGDLKIFQFSDLAWQQYSDKQCLKVTVFF